MLTEQQRDSSIKQISPVIANQIGSRMSWTLECNLEKLQKKPTKKNFDYRGLCWWDWGSSRPRSTRARAARRPPVWPHSFSPSSFCSSCCTCCCPSCRCSSCLCDRKVSGAVPGCIHPPWSRNAPRPDIRDGRWFPAIKTKQTIFFYRFCFVASRGFMQLD